jgi:hypothetical protein
MPLISILSKVEQLSTEGNREKVLCEEKTLAYFDAPVIVLFK